MQETIIPITEAGDSPPAPSTDVPSPSLFATSPDLTASKIREVVGLASESEMAAILQVSEETLATWRTKRKGPPSIKLGKKVFYLVEQFGKWVMQEVERQTMPPIPRAPRARRAFKTPVHVDEDQAGVHLVV